MTLATIETDAQALNSRGIARLQSGDTKGALEDFHEAALTDPDYPEPWNNSGLVRQLLGQAPLGLADFERALAIRPDYPEALSNRGRTRQALGDGAGALADFNRAAELVGPTSFAASVLHNRGRLRQECGDLAGARTDFDRALEIDPGHTATYASRGELRKQTGDLRGALVDFEQALAQNPTKGLAAIYHGRGGVRVLLNDFVGAVADYDRALQIEPDRFLFHISRGNARYHRRDLGAVLDFQAAFRLDPEGAAREVLRILMSDLKRDAQDVLDKCAKHLRICERDVLAYARRGLTLLLVGRNAEARSDLAVVRERVPDMVRFLDRLVALAGNDRNRGNCRPADSSPPLSTSVIDRVFAACRFPERTATARVPLGGPEKTYQTVRSRAVIHRTKGTEG
jgi:tetratricopeptide (TPR) repeat protein